MKLGAVGVVTGVIGAVLGLPGLIGIGAWWVATGLLARRHAQQLKAATPEGGQPPTDGRTFAVGTLIFALIGVPSLVVGIVPLGIDDHEALRFLPIGIGCFAIGVGGLGAVLYLTGSAAQAYVDRGPNRNVPATIRIRAVRETGTYVNERPRLEFQLHVVPDAGTGVEPYDTAKKATVPFTAMGSLRVGDGFRAQVAGPEHPTSMDIDWDQPVPGTSSPHLAKQPDTAARLDALDVLRRDGKVTEEEYQAQRARILESL